MLAASEEIGIRAVLATLPEAADEALEDRHLKFYELRDNLDWHHRATNHGMELVGRLSNRELVTHLARLAQATSRREA